MVCSAMPAPAFDDPRISRKNKPETITVNLNKRILDMYRPLSPHLFIYKPQLSSIFPVFHRITGSFLAPGPSFSIIILKFYASHATHYSTYHIGYSPNTYPARITIGPSHIPIHSSPHHPPNGIRHSIRDFSQSEQFLERDKLDTSASVVILLTFVPGSAAIYSFQVAGNGQLSGRA